MSSLSKARQHADLIGRSEQEDPTLEAVRIWFETLKVQIETISDAETSAKLAKLELRMVESDSISASTLNFDDGSSLIMVHRHLLEWIMFVADACLFGVGELRTFPRAPSRSRAAMRGVLRSRLIENRISFETARPGIGRKSSMGWETSQVTHYAIVYVLAHECGHALLGHGTSASGFSYWDHTVPAVRAEHRFEREADEFAAETLAAYSRNFSEIMGISSPFELQASVIGVMSAASAICIWEAGFFMRIARTHPPAMLRYDHVKTVSISRLGSSRSDRRKIRTWMKCKALFDLVTAGILLNPLRESDWLAVESSPLLSETEKARTLSTRQWDDVACRRTGLDWVAFCRKYNLDVDSLTSWKERDTKAYLARIGMPESHASALLNLGSPLTIRGTIEYFVGCEALSGVSDPFEKYVAASDLAFMVYPDLFVGIFD